MKLSNEIKEEFDHFDFQNHRYLLAYSGGPDSVYLLWMLAIYYQDKLNEHIAICYINYHDSPFVDQEEKLVYSYVERFQIKIYKDDVYYHKEKDKNFEEWARNYRYNLFEKIVKEGGYNTVYISGIPSFCAAAAEVGVPLCEWTEPLHVIPAVHKLDEKLPPDGNYVLMKSGSKMAQVKEILRESRDNVSMVENCGMPDQKVYHSIDEIPDDAGYFSLIIAK